MDTNEFTQYNPLLDDILQSSANTSTQNVGGVVTHFGPTVKVFQNTPTTQYTTTSYVVQETNSGNVDNFQDFDFNFLQNDGATTNVVTNLPPIQTTVHESIEPFVPQTNVVPGTVTTYTTTTKKVNVPVSAPTPVPTTVQTTTYKLTPPEENEILKLVNLQSPQTVETTT